MLKPRLCDYSDGYILVSGAIKIDGAGADDNAKQLDERNKGVTWKNCALFFDCVGEINNTQINIAKDLDVVILMYNLIEYSDNCSKTWGSLWQYYRDDLNDDLINSESFKFKIKVTEKTPAVGNWQ